jgi:hypothetical protein
MDARSFLKLVVLSGPVLMLVVGCFNVVPPENAVTWGLKAVTGRLTEATPTEWQALAVKVDERTPTVDVSLTGEQAEAIVDFVQANELDSIQDIIELVEQAANDPNSISDIEIPESMITLFGDVDFASISDEILAELLE